MAGSTGILLGTALYYAENYEGALSQLKHSVELDSSLWIGHANMGLVLDRLGSTEEAVAEFRLAVQHSENGALAKAHLACGLAEWGDKPGAREILNSLLRLRQRQYFSPYWIAVIHMALNEPPEALKWLEIATEERCSWIVFMRQDPKFAVLRSDGRFRHIVDSIRPPHGIGSPP